MKTLVRIVRKSARLPFTNICSEKAANGAFWGVSGSNRANGSTGNKRQGPAASHARTSKDLFYGKSSTRRARRSIVRVASVRASRLGRQTGYDRPARRVGLDLGDRRRQADRLCPHEKRAQPLRAGVLVGSVARGTL